MMFMRRDRSAVEQSARYQSVPELQRDVQAYQNGFATSAEHASLAKQLVLLVRRHKAVFGTSFAAAAVIFAVFKTSGRWVYYEYDPEKAR